MQLSAGRIGIGKRGSQPSGYSAGGSTAPALTNVPGTYGGPPGSFITRSSCPPGYNPVALSRGDIRCVPMPRAVSSPPVQSSPVTIAPTFQQDFTPQFSPVVQQQQDSPGAGQSASPVQEATPTIVAIPPPAPITDTYNIPSALPIPSPVPRVITAPSPPPPEKKSYLPTLKDNYLPLILIAGVAALFYGMKK